MWSGEYFDGAQSVTCNVLVSQGMVIVYPENSPLITWPLEKSVITETPDSISLSYSGGHLTLKGNQAASFKAAMRVAPQPARRKDRFTVSALAIIGISGIVITVLLIFGLYSSLPYVSGKVADMVPVEYEVDLGENIAQQFASQVDDADSVNYYLERFTASLKLDDQYPIRVRLIRSPEINAFAVPGGNIFIYAGLLAKMETPEDLVALLGHEVTHVVKRHSLRSLLSRATTGVLFSVVLGNSGIGSLISKADELKQLDYSRELETEADNYGLGIMLLNEVDPTGMLRLLQILDQQSVEDPGLMKYLSTHPETQARIASVKTHPAMGKTFAGDPYRAKLFSLIQSHLGVK